MENTQESQKIRKRKNNKENRKTERKWRDEVKPNRRKGESKEERKEKRKRGWRKNNVYVYPRSSDKTLRISVQSTVL